MTKAGLVTAYETLGYWQDELQSMRGTLGDQTSEIENELIQFIFKVKCFRKEIAACAHGGAKYAG